MLPDEAVRVRAAAERLHRAPRATADASGIAVLDEHVTSLLRVVVAAAGLAVFWIDPSEDARRRIYAYAVLGCFVAYSVVVHALVLRRARRVPAVLAPWIDLAWVTLLIAVSQGTSSIFFPLYLFVVLCAAFQGGFRSGELAVAASVFSFSVVGGLTSPNGPAFELDRSLIRPMYLLILGYLISRWGEHEANLRRRMALLRDVTTLSNPRFGVDRTLGQLLERLRTFYRADACRLVVADARAGASWTRGASGGQEPSPPVALPDELARILLPEPLTAALLYRDGRFCGHSRTLEVECTGVVEGARAAHPPPAAPLERALGARAFVSVPFRYHADAVARLYLTSERACTFDASDVDFLQHVVDQVIPVLENMRLVDRLASDAAEEERRRLARDVHDSVIQPFVGLRLALAAPRDALEEGRIADARRDLQRIAEIVDAETERLRAYVRRLSRGDATVPGSILPVALRRFCDRFADATGIRVDVDAARAELNDRLTAEVLQMVAEALSNVRRHTDASRADVHVAMAEGHLKVEVVNDGAPASQRAFTPRSLSERAAALGGQLQVEQRPGATALCIDIPL